MQAKTAPARGLTPHLLQAWAGTVRSFLAQGPRGVIPFGTQGSDLTPFHFISSVTWYVSLILEESEEPPSVEEEAGSSSVSKSGGEHRLGVEGVLPSPRFQVSVEQSLWVESQSTPSSGVLHRW